VTSPQAVLDTSVVLDFDRACLALALTRGLPADTAERSWAKLKLGIDIRLIR
jgi:PIN domain nuclease of toxin-antitoxin system